MRWLGLVLGVLAVGCAADATDDEDEVTELSADEIAASEEITIGQFNPYYGGQFPMYSYDEDRSKLPRNYATAGEYGRLVRGQHGRTALIGMQEMDSPAIAEEMRKRLGDGWRVKWYGGAKMTGSAIYWRDDVLAFEKDFGTHVVNHFDAAHGGTATTFGGALFVRKGTSKRLGFFTGKLTPRTFDGHDDREKDDEAKNLTAWIGDVMRGHPVSARVLSVDMNDPYGGLAWNVFTKTFADGGDREATWKSPHSGKWFRYDYVWYDYDGGAKRGGGIVGSPVVMGGSGSDHRAVFTRVRLH